MTDILKELSLVLEQRRADNSPESSYVARLHKQGLNKILEKIGEETTETILAAKDYQAAKEENKGTDKSALIGETADLWFHSLVMLSHLDANADDVLQELGRRFGISGIDEKASRGIKA